jgi:hypothetical protein
VIIIHIISHYKRIMTYGTIGSKLRLFRGLENKNVKRGIYVAGSSYLTFFPALVEHTILVQRDWYS